MKATNYTEFRKDLKEYLDCVEESQEIIVIKRGSGKGAVLISLEEYNSIMETMYLLKSRKNAERLYESIEQINSGKTVVLNLPGE
jgi:antitoxin YefM